MTKWYDKPTKVLSMEKDVDYIMCIDENGSSTNLGYVLKQLSNNREIAVDDKYFTITGCIFTKKQYIESKNIINELKKNIGIMVCFLIVK